jgi:solute:Na+ symporter, SSS family
MPIGLTGAFVAMILAANVSTHDIYLHSWGSIFVQDIIMPLRKKPFTEKQHMWALRLSILFVGIFICFFSCVFRQTQHIMYFFALTGAIWMGGVGAVIIGGLYTRWGTTTGAYVALIIGSILAFSGMVCDQLWVSWYGKNFFLTGQEIYFLAMLVSWILYVVFSLIGKRTHFDLDKMLHRGQYRIAAEHLDSDTEEQSSACAKFSFKKVFGISNDFTRGDKIIYGITIYKSLALFMLFVIMTCVAIFWGLSDRQWSTYHYYMLWFMISTSFIIAVWLLVGGILDARSLLRDLLTSKREIGDDGRVVAKNYQENTADDTAVESGGQRKS